MLTIAVYLFPMLMLFAACHDLFTMRISNRISIVLAIGFLPLALLGGMAPSLIATHYACGAAVLAITFTLFALGKIGGGDAKLAASSVIWIGWEPLVDYLIVTSLLGGALAVFLLLARQVALPLILLKQDWIARLHEPRGGIPYGVALGLAGVLVYPDTAIWRAAFGA